MVSAITPIPAQDLPELTQRPWDLNPPITALVQKVNELVEFSQEVPEYGEQVTVTPYLDDPLLVDVVGPAVKAYLNDPLLVEIPTSAGSVEPDDGKLLNLGSFYIPRAELKNGQYKIDSSLIDFPQWPTFPPDGADLPSAKVAFVPVGDPATTDQSAAIDAQYQEMTQGGIFRRVLWFTWGSYRCDRTFRVDLQKGSMGSDGGTTFNMGGLVDEYAVEFMSTGPAAAAAGRVSPIQNIKFIGPGYNRLRLGTDAPTMTQAQINAITSRAPVIDHTFAHFMGTEIGGVPNPVSGFALWNCLITAFSRAFFFDDHAYIIKMFMTSVGQCGIGHHTPQLFNGGESMEYFACTFSGNWKSFLIEDGDTQVQFWGGSLDYCQQDIHVKTGGRFTGHGVHLERDAGYTLPRITRESGGNVLMVDCDMVSTGTYVPGTSYPAICLNNPDPTNLSTKNGTSVIRFDNLYVNATPGADTVFSIGRGITIVKGTRVTPYLSNKFFLVSREEAMNLLPDGHFRVASPVAPTFDSAVTPPAAQAQILASMNLARRFTPNTISITKAGPLHVIESRRRALDPVSGNDVLTMTRSTELIMPAKNGVAVSTGSLKVTKTAAAGVLSEFAIIATPRERESMPGAELYYARGSAAALTGTITIGLYWAVVNDLGNYVDISDRQLAGTSLLTIDVSSTALLQSTASVDNWVRHTSGNFPARAQGDMDKLVYLINLDAMGPGSLFFSGITMNDF